MDSKKVALFFGETQPRISNLMNGDIEMPQEAIATEP